LEEMLYDDAAAGAVRANVRTFALGYVWSRTLLPLINFCRLPRRAPDLALEPLTHPERAGAPPRRRPSVREDLALARGYLAAGGVPEVGRRAMGRVRRLAGGSVPPEA